MEVAKSEVKEIGTLFAKGIGYIKQAAEKLVGVIDNGGLTIDDVCEQLTIPIRILEGLEMVGRGAMDSRLLISSGSNTGRIKRLPYSDQKRILDGEKLTLVVGDGDTIMVDPKDCSAEQAKQLFIGSHIRDVGEQRAYIEAEREALKRDAVSTQLCKDRIKKCWKIENGVLYVERGVIAKEDLGEIIKEMM